jgi:hypothetical protein
MSTVFHYAPWAYLPSIAERGELLLSSAGGRPDEPGLLWFSAHPHWEPTATKNWMRTNGVPRRMTFAEQVERAGCIRFALAADDSRLLCWKDACSYAGIPRDERRALEASGRRIGGNPAQWFASTMRIPLRDLLLHVWLGNWRASDDIAGMAAAWSERKASGAA